MNTKAKKHISFLCTFLIILSIISMCTFSVSAENNNLKMELKDYVQNDTDITMIIDIENNTEYTYSIGWGYYPTAHEIDTTTTEGFFQAYVTDYMIPEGNSTLTVVFDGAKGTPQAVMIPTLHILKDGIPQRAEQNVFVYAYDENPSYFESDMSDDVFYEVDEELQNAHDIHSKNIKSVQNMMKWMFLIPLCFICVGLVVVVILMIRTHKKNKQNMQQFDPFVTQTPPPQDVEKTKPPITHIEGNFTPPPQRK